MPRRQWAFKFKDGSGLRLARKPGSQSQQRDTSNKRQRTTAPASYRSLTADAEPENFHSLAADGGSENREDDDDEFEEDYDDQWFDELVVEQPQIDLQAPAAAAPAAPAAAATPAATNPAAAATPAAANPAAAANRV